MGSKEGEAVSLLASRATVIRRTFPSKRKYTALPIRLTYLFFNNANPCFRGTGVKLMKNGPKHIMDAEDFEPLYVP